MCSNSCSLKSMEMYTAQVVRQHYKKGLSNNDFSTIIKSFCMPLKEKDMVDADFGVDMEREDAMWEGFHAL